MDIACRDCVFYCARLRELDIPHKNNVCLKSPIKCWSAVAGQDVITDYLSCQIERSYGFCGLEAQWFTPKLKHDWIAITFSFALALALLLALLLVIIIFTRGI